MSFGRRTLSHREQRVGSYYTPQSICQAMVRNCLAPVLKTTGGRKPKLRVLDPACGDGAFLVEVFHYLERWYLDSATTSEKPFLGDMVSECSRTRLSIAARIRLVEEHLFGVDIDAHAIHLLRDELIKCIEPDDQTARKRALNMIRRNIRVGDALTGADFTDKEQRSSHTPTTSSEDGIPTPIVWADAFPRVAAAGGFDVVIGNPPYLRERNAKSLFDRIASSPLGAKWRQARMDLWYYFLHRGLDLLRPDGRLSYIVNSYWTASSGATKLIDRLRRKTTFEEFVLLGQSRVFRNVVGRHMIFRLRKNSPDDVSQQGLKDISEVYIENTCRIIDQSGSAEGNSATHEMQQRELYVGGRILLHRRKHWMNRLEHLPTLGAAFDVRQGMAENPPVISSRLAREFPGQYQTGEGVFVLTQEELDKLSFSDQERELLRPYYGHGAIGRYRLSHRPTHFVLYLNRSTTLSEATTPRVLCHLKRFRPILERRRETRQGTLPWWQLHWPREERLFTEPRILGLQMGKEPQFVWAQQPTFVGFSRNLILRKSPHLGCSLKTLTGILNSTMARQWFTTFAKRRGVRLEISGTLLTMFPMPKHDKEREQQIAELVTQRQTMSCPAKSATSSVLEIDAAIDRLVEELYRVDLS